MTEQQYAISEYPDVKDVYQRLDALVRQPMRPVRPERMQEYLNYFEMLVSPEDVSACPSRLWPSNKAGNNTKILGPTPSRPM